MKKFNFAKIVSLICVCAMLLGALTIATFAADETDEVVIASNNVYYGEKFQIMYAISKGVDDITAVDSQGNSVEVVSFTDPDTGASTVTLNGVEYDMYITKDGVAAQAIDEVITVTVKANGETARRSYSVLQYTYERTQALKAKEQTDDDDVVKELAMLNALVSYADATNAFLNNATGSFTDYKYVTVAGATVDGVNPTGMYAAGATPFANLELALDYDSNNQILRWYVDGELSDLDTIKAIKVADKSISVEAVVLDKCFDGHTWIDPTCSEDGYCDVCGADGEAAVDHKDENSDYKCDFNCGTQVLPEADSTLTIPQANALGLTFANNTYTSDKYYVTGVITQVANTQYGNVYIKDSEDNTFYIYGLYSIDGSTRYDAMSYKPVVGDEITVWGIIGTYNGNEAQMKDAWADEIIQHIPSYSDATCTAPKTCKLCGATEGEALGHTEANAEGKCDRCGTDLNAAQPAELTLSFESTNNRTSFSTTAQVWEQDGVTLTNNKGSSTSNVANYSNPVRFYKSSNIVIECDGMTKIVFTCNTAAYATSLKNSITADSNITVTVSSSVVTVEFTKAVDEFTVTLTDGQVRMNSLTVTALQ